MRRRILLSNLGGGDKGSENGYEWIKIGQYKWATKNIGANSETDYGLYFSWGETTGYVNATSKSTKKGNKTYTGFTWASYANNLYTGTSTTYTATSVVKYTGTDNTVLQPEDDAAHIIMGGNWKMPTDSAFKDLTANTTSEWVTNYNNSGINGRLFTSKSDSTLKLFFPAAGYCRNGSVSSAGSYGNYWSSSLDTSNVSYGWYLYFNSSYVYIDFNFRYLGRSVRGVVVV